MKNTNLLICLLISLLYSCKVSNTITSAEHTKNDTISFFQMSVRTIGQDNFTFDTHNTYTFNSHIYINNNTIIAPMTWLATKHTFKYKYITYKNCNVSYGSCPTDTSIKYITINQLNRTTTFFYKN